MIGEREDDMLMVDRGHQALGPAHCPDEEGRRGGWLKRCNNSEISFGAARLNY